MKTGWIGLGNLGLAMARRIRETNPDLLVWNRSPEKGREEGFHRAGSPAELVEKTNLLWINLYDSDSVDSVFRRKDGLLSGGIDLSGKIFIDTTTNHFDRVLSFHETVQARGGVYLEAPVLGSVVPASRGELTMLVSGPGETYESVRGELEKLATKIFFLGSPGLASRMKLINNHVLGGLMALLGEAVATAEATGLPRDLALDILSAGGGNSAVLSAKKEKLRRGDFSPHFSSRLIHRDLQYLEELAYRLKRPVHTSSPVKNLYASTFARGEEDLDFSAIYRIFAGDRG